MDILSWHIQNLISSSGVIQFLYSKTQLIHGKTPQQDSTARSLVVIYSVGRLLQFMECKLHIWVRLSTTQFVGSLNMQIAANFLLLDMQLLQICLITPTIYLHACKELKSFEKMAEALKKLDVLPVPPCLLSMLPGVIGNSKAAGGILPNLSPRNAHS